MNHVERQILHCGYSLERVTRDYGIDLILFTYNQQGEAEVGQILLQVKATEQTTHSADQQAILFRITRVDLQRWLFEPMPLILTLYDTSRDTAWWIHVQEYFATPEGVASVGSGRTMTVRFPVRQVLNPETVLLFRGFRDRVLEQFSR